MEQQEGAEQQQEQQGGGDAAAQYAGMQVMHGIVAQGQPYPSAAGASAGGAGMYSSSGGGIAQQQQQQQQQLGEQMREFWEGQMREVEEVCEFKSHNLPLARIKKIMKADEDVRMISGEAPVLFAKACEMFILELTLRAWNHTEENKRRTLQKNDIAAAVTRTDIFDFLVDIVPRDDMMIKEEGSLGSSTMAAAAARAAAAAAAAAATMPIGAPADMFHHYMMPGQPPIYHHHQQQQQQQQPPRPLYAMPPQQQQQQQWSSQDQQAEADESPVVNGEQ